MRPHPSPCRRRGQARITDGMARSAAMDCSPISLWQPMIAVRAGVSDPLRIDFVPVGGGWLGVTLCPGRRQPVASTGAWNRDLDTDLKAIRAFGAAALVTLMEGAELEPVGVAVDLLRRHAADLGIEWHYLPIPDAGTPDEAFEAAWTYAGERRPMLVRVCTDCCGRAVQSCCTAWAASAAPAPSQRDCWSRPGPARRMRSLRSGARARAASRPGRRRPM